MQSLLQFGAALPIVMAVVLYLGTTTEAADVRDPLTYRVALLGNPSTPVAWDEAQVKALADAGFNAVQLNIAWLRRPYDEALNLIDVVTRPGDVEPPRTAERRAELLRRCALAKKFGLRTIFHFGSPFMWRNPETGEIKRGQPDAFLADPQWFDVQNPAVVEFETALLAEFRRQFPDVDDIEVYTYDQDAWQTSEFDERELSRGIPLHERLPKYLARLHEVWTEGREGHHLWWEPWELSAGQVYKCLPELPTTDFGLMLHVNIAETQITKPADVWFRNTVRMAASRGIPVVAEAFLGSATEEIEPLSIPCPRLVDEQFRALTAVRGVVGLKEYFGVLPLVPDLNLDMFTARLNDRAATTDQLLDRITQRFGPQQAEVKRLMATLSEAFDMFPWDASWHIRTVGLATPDHGWEAAFIRGMVADTPSWLSTRRAHFMATEDHQPHPWMLEDVQLRCELAAAAFGSASNLSGQIAAACAEPADRTLFEGIARDTAHVERVARAYALHLRETNVALLLRRDLENGRPLSPKLLDEMKSLLAADVANQNGGARAVAMQKEFASNPAAFVTKRLVPTTQRSKTSTHHMTTR